MEISPTHSVGYEACNNIRATPQVWRQNHGPNPPYVELLDRAGVKYDAEYLWR